MPSLSSETKQVMHQIVAQVNYGTGEHGQTPFLVFMTVKCLDFSTVFMDSFCVFTLKQIFFCTTVKDHPSPVQYFKFSVIDQKLSLYSILQISPTFDSHDQFSQSPLD